MTEVELSELEADLLKLKADILGSEDVKDEAAQTVVLDQSSFGRLSRMDAMQAQAMAQELKRRNEIQLKRIDLALRRIETEDYGYCQACDEEIDVRRLKFDPATPFCIACADKQS